MMRRVVGAIVGTAAIAAALSGCLFPVDAALLTISYRNHYDENVIVAIEGANVKFETLVPRDSSFLESMPDCGGTGIRVETEGGELIGRIDEQACPDWTLTINEDGSLDYVED